MFRNMTNNSLQETLESDIVVDQLIRECDKTVMPIPDFISDPHLLISKVRKHYMECIIKILSVNYETNQKLMKKKLYLPSAIWRCAKNIEMAAAQNCMVVQLYRKYIVAEISEMKNNTKNGKLFKKLNDCLNQPSKNEKKTQTQKNKECNCQCTCGRRKRRCTTSISPDNVFQNQSQSSQVATGNETMNGITEICYDDPRPNHNTENPSKICNLKDEVFSDIKSLPAQLPCVQMSVESQDSDELMMQLEKMFQGDPCDEDIFDGTLCESIDTFDDSNKKSQPDIVQVLVNNTSQYPGQDMKLNQTETMTSLDDRLVSIGAVLVNNENYFSQQKPEKPKCKRSSPSKWLCEEYFCKLHLYEQLDRIGDCNRRKLARIKAVLIELFGDDSDDEGGVVSPLEETPEFIISCKERIAPWVVKLLTPYYVKGRIKGKTLFKALAKHLIRLIYQCSHYPGEYEVNSFVSDFLENHKMIRCEADFKQFKIDNI